MRLYLGALGWVDEEPRGNRLRWSVPVDAQNSDGFLGLPVTVIIERAPINPEAPGDTALHESSSWTLPFSWWDILGDITVPPGVNTRLDLSTTAQALTFFYSGPETMVRVRDEADTVVAERHLVNGSHILLEEPEITTLEFLIGGGSLNSARLLDLFAGHDAGVDYDEIAVLSPAKTIGLTLEQAEARLGENTALTQQDWADFHSDVVTPALLSGPDTPTFENTGTTSWQQFSALLAVRWSLSVLYGFGFLDGPDAGPGASVDNVNSGALLNALPTRSHIYRVRVTFDDHPELISNPIIVRNQIALPLSIPNELDVEHATVRLFDGADYELDAQLSLGTDDARVIGCEIEEEYEASAILGAAPFTDTTLFQSWRGPDWSRRMRIKRDVTLPFYDMPFRFRARGLDGWDRTSDWSPWSPLEMPAFLHSPLPPALMDAQIVDEMVQLYPRTPGNRFTEWEPDHAARNTPGTVLEVMRQYTEPQSTSVTLFDPMLEDVQPGQAVDSFRAFFSNPIPAPLRFIGGSLISGSMRAAIIAINTQSVVFRPIAGGADTAKMVGAGPAILQQSPTHTDLFTSVFTTGIDDLPGVLAFTDTLPAAKGRTMPDHYAVRVDMGIVTGGLSNTATALRHPPPLDPPPPFTVQILGVDFFGRTSISVRFSSPAANVPYVVAWADGMPEADDFHDLAVEGDYGPQTADDALELFETLTLPVPINLSPVITIGVQAKTEGGFVSHYTLQQISLPLYSA